MVILQLLPNAAPKILSLDDEGAGIDYNLLTLVELKSIAENKGIKVNSNMKKVNVIKAIKESEI